MEHIVQFAVNVDDNRIGQICEESAAKQIAEDIKLVSHGRNYYGKVNDNPENLKKLFKNSIDKYVKEHADEIIQGAIQEVAKNMMKTKKVKEAVEKLVKEDE